MLDLALKDIKEHKIRTFLTVLGIVIAIAAIVSLGSISSGMNSFVNKQMALLSGIVTLEEAGAIKEAGPPQGKILLEDLEAIENIAGVEEVAPLYISSTSNGFIAGVDFEKMELFDLEEIKVKEGDWPESEDYKVVLGSYVAEQANLDIGDTIVVEGEELEVIGILEEMNTFMDFGAITSLETVQNLYDDYEYATVAYVKLEDISDADRITEEIENEYSYIDARTMEDNLKRAKETISQIRIMTLSIGFVTSIIAAIGIINTMFMSITERKRDIGIMKAIGAKNKQIIYQVLQEGILLSIIGGVTGLLFGFIGTIGMNRMIGISIARVTFGLAAGSILFALSLTQISSLYPAIIASKTDPIDAIRGNV